MNTVKSNKSSDVLDLSFYKGKSVFLTGHTGFKGSWLCRILLNAGAKVTGYALPVAQEPALFSLCNNANDMESITGDIRNYEALKATMKKAQPQVVFHLAAQPIVRLSYSEPRYTYEANVMGTVNVLEAVREVSSVSSFINITTDKVYLNREWLWGYREDEELCGFDPYSNSKSCSELVTYSYKHSFFTSPTSPAISTARSGNVIGGGDFAPDRIIPDCVRSSLKKKPIIIRNPNSTRPYQHVLECLSGYLLLAKKQYENKTLASSYNFGPDDSSCVTTGQLASLFCTSWQGAVWQNVSEKDAPHEANFLKLDCAKAKSVLGWKPHWDIAKAVEKSALWYQAVLQEKQNAKDYTDSQIKEYFAL